MPPVRLVICVDGTSNTQWGSLDPLKGTINGVVTSVRRIHDMVKEGQVKGSDNKPYEQRLRYFQGVATEDVNKDIVDDKLHIFLRPRAVFQAVTGSGYLDILRSAYQWCCTNLSSKDDEIWMFGFSRGAFIVRALASLLQHVGLIKPDEMITDSAFRRRFNDQLQRYTLRTSVKSISFLDRETMLPFATPSPRIRFVGVFDTVKSVFPKPITNTIAHGVPFLDLEQDAPRLVQHFRHALAMSEGRPHFSPTLWRSNAHSTNPDASFLEAWFFGYHSDVGGGNPRRGVALWPLQWMLTSAIDQGLVLSDENYKHPILFPTEVKTVNMPHQPGMKMSNMMQHHAADGRYRLLLHQPSPLLQLEPRNFRSSLTTPPYSGVINSRVFLHPSAYLQFNISSQFRIQLYRWKWFRNFVRDRFRAIPLEVPWWEQETEKNLLQDILPIRQMRLLIYGVAGLGKLDLINKAFGHPGVALSAASNITLSVQIPGNNLMDVHYSDGVRTDSFADVEKFISSYTSKKEVEDQLHAIWYCIDLMDDPVTPEELKFSSLKFEKIPVIVVLTREEEMRLKIRNDFLALPGGVVTDEMVEEALDKRIAEKRKEINGLVEWSYVPTGTSKESAKNLLSVTFQNLDDPRVQITEIRAQQASSRLKIAIATDQAIRAYAIWRAFTVRNESIVFRQKPAGQMTLSAVLMEPILDSFNFGFAGDTKLIQSRSGTPWMKELDAFKTSMWDIHLPAHLILFCMVDTMVIMARVMTRGTNLTKPLRRTRALHEAAIETACTWYNLKQVAVHTRIRALLDKKGLPQNGSMALFQLALIETIDFGLSSTSDLVGESVDAVVAVGRNVSRGAFSATLSAATVGSGIVFGLAHEVRRGMFG